MAWNVTMKTGEIAHRAIRTDPAVGSCFVPTMRSESSPNHPNSSTEWDYLLDFTTTCAHVCTYPHVYTQYIPIL